MDIKKQKHNPRPIVNDLKTILGTREFCHQIDYEVLQRISECSSALSVIDDVVIAFGDNVLKTNPKMDSFRYNAIVNKMKIEAAKEGKQITQEQEKRIVQRIIAGERFSIREELSKVEYAPLNNDANGKEINSNEILNIVLSVFDASSKGRYIPIHDFHALSDISAMNLVGHLVTACSNEVNEKHPKWDEQKINAFINSMRVHAVRLAKHPTALQEITLLKKVIAGERFSIREELSKDEYAPLQPLQDAQVPDVPQDR